MTTKTKKLVLPAPKEEQHVDENFSSGTNRYLIPNAEARGWNKCLEEIKRLNGGKP